MTIDDSLLRDAYSLLCSSHSVAERRGTETNWEPFERQLKDITSRLHQRLYPETYRVEVVVNGQPVTVPRQPGNTYGDLVQVALLKTGYERVPRWVITVDDGSSRGMVQFVESPPPRRVFLNLPAGVGA